MGCTPPSENSMRKGLISFLLAVLGSVSSLVVPAYTAVTVRKTAVRREPALSAEAETPVRVVHLTLAQVNGRRTYFLSAIPVVVAGLPLLFRFRAIRLLAAALLTFWVVIGAASIGLFYLPSAIMMSWFAFAKSA